MLSSLRAARPATAVSRWVSSARTLSGRVASSAVDALERNPRRERVQGCHLYVKHAKFSPDGSRLMFVFISEYQKPLDEVDLILIRETTEDVYAGIEFAAGDADAERLADWLRDRGKRVPAGAALAVKVTSAAGARRVFEFAAGYAARYSRKHLTAVHKSTVLPATTSSGLM